MQYLLHTLKVPSSVLQPTVASAELHHMRPTQPVRRNLDVYIPSAQSQWAALLLLQNTQLVHSIQLLCILLPKSKNKTKQNISKKFQDLN